MKKLLSLLSVLTIGGTSLPTTVAASPYQKQENKLEKNKTNFLESNDTENLKRNKRGLEKAQLPSSEINFDLGNIIDNSLETIKIRFQSRLNLENDDNLIITDISFSSAIILRSSNNTLY